MKLLIIANVNLYYQSYIIIVEWFSSFISGVGSLYKVIPQENLFAGHTAKKSFLQAAVILSSFGN